MGGSQTKGIIHPEPVSEEVSSVSTDPYVMMAMTILNDYPRPYRTLTLLEKVAEDLRNGVTVEEVRKRISNTIMIDYFRRQTQTYLPFQ